MDCASRGRAGVIRAVHDPMEIRHGGLAWNATAQENESG